MIDAFLSTMTAYHPPVLHDIRKSIASAVMSRWTLEPVKLVMQYNMSQVERRMKADQWSRTPIYILTDDDMLPIGKDFVERALDIMDRHPQFGVICALPTNAKIVEWSIGQHTNEVFEHSSVGGIRFCRKDIIKVWPEQTHPIGYDGEHGEAIRKAGFRNGYFRNVRANHVGEGYSTLWEIHRGV